MRVCLPIWQQRLSPVFDVATRMLLVDIERGREVRRSVHAIDQAPDAPRRLDELLSWRVDVLICGAVSGPLEQRVRSEGVRVISRVCGSVDEVLRAYLEHRLDDPAFALPGCAPRDRGPVRTAPRRDRTLPPPPPATP